MLKRKLKLPSPNLSPHGRLATLFRRWLTKRGNGDPGKVLMQMMNKISADGTARGRIAGSEPYKDTLTMAKLTSLLVILFPRIKRISITIRVEEDGREPLEETIDLIDKSEE